MTKSAIHIADLLSADAVKTDIVATDKKALIHILSSEAAKAFGLEEHAVFDVLWAREKLGTTGVGHGIAIPHSRIEGLDKVRGFFARLSSPIAFDAIDDQPIDLVFLLLAPQEAGADHLHALAAISRTLRDPALCNNLRNAKDTTALFNALTTATPAVAA